VPLAAEAELVPLAAEAELADAGLAGPEEDEAELHAARAVRMRAAATAAR
jgi:hypothetical protein